MSTHDPARSTPPRPGATRDSGDAWVEAATGERYWGRFGAAGLLVSNPEDGVLLQHRALWSHHGGTWGLPGGALHAGETPQDGALREAHEEAGVPADAVVAFATVVTDRVVWRYTTVLARTATPFVPVAGDGESLELRWVAPQDVDQLPLHPAFGQAWPMLRSMLPTRPVIVVDAANVVGARPDGWWRDREGATQRLAARLAGLSRDGVGAQALGLDGERWVVAIEMVLEGGARGATPVPGVLMTQAPGSGDDHIVQRVAERAAAGEKVTVVTSDRELGRRVGEHGAQVRGTSWLLRLLDAREDAASAAT